MAVDESCILPWADCFYLTRLNGPGLAFKPGKQAIPFRTSVTAIEEVRQLMRIGLQIVEFPRVLEWEEADTPVGRVQGLAVILLRLAGPHGCEHAITQRFTCVPTQDRRMRHPVHLPGHRNVQQMEERWRHIP